MRLKAGPESQVALELLVVAAEAAGTAAAAASARRGGGGRVAAGRDLDDEVGTQGVHRVPFRQANGCTTYP
jgi:hypothetical protein